MAQPFLNTFHKWVILGSVCTISFIVVGLSRLFSLLFVTSLERYGESRKLTSIPFILPYTIRMLVGPLAGYLSGAFGQRFVLMTGSVLCMLAFMLSFFAENIIHIIIFIGVMYGIGFGFGMNTIPHALHQEFEAHINKATGIAFGMASLGGFVLLEVAKSLLSVYGLSGTFFILSGITLHLIPASLLLKEKKCRKTTGSVSDRDKEKMSVLEISGVSNEATESGTKSIDISRKISILREEGDKHCVNTTLPSSNAAQNNTGDNQKPYGMVTSSTNFCVKEFQSCQRREFLSEMETEERTQSSELNEYTEPPATHLKLNEDTEPPATHLKLNEDTEPATHFKLNKDAEPPATHLKLNEGTEPPATHLFRVFMDATFILIALIQGLSYFAMVTFWTVSLDASIDKGVSREEGIKIVIAASISETIGKFSLGFVFEACNMTKINIATCIYFFSGALILIFVWLRAFVMILIVVSIIYLLIGGLMTIHVGIVAIYVEKSHIRMAMASRYFFYTPLSICGPYIIGYFRDVLKTYDGLFYTLSVIFFLSAAMNAVTPAVARFRDKRRNKS